LRARRSSVFLAFAVAGCAQAASGADIRDMRFSIWDSRHGETFKMRMLAFLLAIVCIIAAVVYFVMPAGSLPTFMPGYQAGSAHIHLKHAIIATAGAAVLLLLGWLVGRRARA
jgi:hypothetical protein